MTRISSCVLSATSVAQWQEHCTGIARGVGLIPAGGPIVDEFFSTVPGLNLDMCTIFHSN